MEKQLIWIGTALAIIGFGALALFVLPYVGWDAATGPAAPQNRVAPLVAVLTGGIGLAAGFALIGLGVGRWRHPERSETLPLGQGHNSREV